MAGRELGVELIRVSGLVRYRSREKGSALLLDGLDLTVREGDSIGLVGPNGSGKSTLLRSLAGVETPVEGRVKRAPGVRVAYLPQALPTSASGTVWELASAGLADLKAAELRMRSEEAALASGEDRHEQYAAARAGFDRLGGYAAESGVREILAALGFPASVYKQSVERLSAGSRRRLALAAVLSAGADVILLDEPSNHLDMAARRWLEGHLARRTGAVVVVSHDRALLSTATTTTAFLDHGRLRLVDRGYDHAGGRAGANTPERRDKARAEEARRLEGVAAELARFSRRKRRSRHEPTKAGPAADSARQRKRLSGRLVSAEHVTITGTLDDATIRLDAGERIALLGPNGSGKSVLLRFLAGEVASQDPRTRLQYASGLKLVWLSQESRGLVAEASLLEQASQALGAGLAKRTLAAAGVPHSAWQLAPEQLSGGERARAGLALALARPFDLLLLDEPENDLDLQAVEALETSLRERLEASGAALVLVTHDRRLALNLAGRAWHLSAGSVYAHGSVRAYLRGDEPVPVERFWQEGAVSTNVAEEPTEAPEAPSTGQAPDATEALEAERSALLEDLLDPLAISERERTRTRERLTSVEEQLMAIYDERLEPAAPSRRFVERGVTVFADALAERRWAAVVADDSAAAREALRRPEAADRPWLELRTVEDVAHLKLHEQGDSCLLPWAKRALLDAGARLAFTVLGVGSVQYFDRGIAGTMLEPVGDGWWRLTLERFLAKEGWPVRPRQPRRRRRGDGERGGGAA